MFKCYRNMQASEAGEAKNFSNDHIKNDFTPYGVVFLAFGALSYKLISHFGFHSCCAFNSAIFASKFVVSCSFFSNMVERVFFLTERIRKVFLSSIYIYI